MFKKAVSVLSSPLTYVLLFYIGGAASIIAGVAILAGSGWALVSIGAFLKLSAWYITRGIPDA